MSNFWDNNKESILSGAKTAAVTTGKYGYKGAKFVGKTGYQAAKNQRAVNVRGQTGQSKEESPSFAEARPLNSLPSVDHLPPPPLKPGQGQYTSKSKTPPQAQVAQPVPQQYAQQPVQQPVQQQFQQPVQQPQLPQRNIPQPPQQQTIQTTTYVQQPAQQQVQVPAQQEYATSTQQAFVQQSVQTTAQAQAQPPAMPSRDQPLTSQQPQQQPAGQLPFQQSLQQTLQKEVQQFVQPQGSQPEPQAATATAPMLDFKNPYYRGAVSQPQEYKVEPLSNESSPAQTPVQNTSAPPPPALGPRTYNRAAVLPPQGASQPDAIQQPQPQVPVQAPAAQQAEQSQVQPSQNQAQQPLTVNTEAANSVATKLPVQQIAGLNLGEQTVQSPDLSKLPIPPKHTDLTPSGSPSARSSKLNQTNTGGASSLNKTQTATTTDGEHAEEPKKGISGAYDYKIDVKFAPPPKPRGAAPPQDRHKPSSRTSTAAPPTPARSSTTTPRPSSSRQSPAPPPARQPATGSTSSLSHPPPPPARSSAGSSANVSDVEDNSGVPPPYAATAESDSHSAQQSSTNISRPPPKTFAPPPKPFRRPAEASSERSRPESSTRPAQFKPPAPPTRTASDVSALSLPPPANPNAVEDSKPKKAPPPVIKPKPSNIDAGSVKKAPPPVKPKPSGFAGEKKTPPPIVGKKPSISIPDKKPSPPIPTKKPSIPSSSRTAVGAAAGNFSAVVSELPRKNNDKTIPVKNNNGVTKEDFGSKQEDEDEDFEDNPFKRYLKNAVPKEDDRFKR